MRDWLASFSNNDFMPHGHCYLWRPDILWTHVISDLVITVAYYTIPIVLGIFLYRRKKSIPYRGILCFFVAFIFLCGTTHLFRIYVTWFPAYEIESWLKAATAAVSITTALYLIPKLPELIALPGIQQAYEQSQSSLKILQENNEKMSTMYNVSMDREERIIELKQEVNELLKSLNKPERYSINPDDV